MNTPSYMEPMDVHEALARAHAERGAFFAAVAAGVATLVKRLAAALRPHHGRHKGAVA